MTAAETDARIEQEIARYTALSVDAAGFRRLVELARVASNQCRDWSKTAEEEGGWFSSAPEETLEARRFWCTVAGAAAALVKERRAKVQNAAQIEAETLAPWDARDRKIEDLERDNTGFWSVQTLRETIAQGGERAAATVRALLDRLLYWLGLAAEMPGADRAAGLGRLALVVALGAAGIFLAARLGGAVAASYASAIKTAIGRTQRLAATTDAAAAASLGV